MFLEDFKCCNRFTVTGFGIKIPEIYDQDQKYNNEKYLDNNKTNETIAQNIIQYEISETVIKMEA
jgi:hypothetical protein